MIIQCMFPDCVIDGLLVDVNGVAVRTTPIAYNFKILKR